jgi:anti-anti-sigma factor
MTTAGTSQSMPFTADCSRNANELSLRVSGRLIEPRQPSPDWSACLERLAGVAIRVDLGSVTEIDARGLGMLAELTRETRRRGGDVMVVKASPRVRRLLELTHLDTLLQDAPGRGPRLAA